MTNEARMPPDVNAETPGTPAAQAPEPQPVLSVNEAGAVSARKRGKAGPSAKKAAPAAKRKPEKKKPVTRKAAAKKTASRAGDARFRSTTAAKGSWKSPAKRASGSKPTAAQKKGPIKKSSARKAAPAAKRGQAKRATRRR